jgi:hypothetical protein
LTKRFVAAVGRVSSSEFPVTTRCKALRRSEDLRRWSREANRRRTYLPMPAVNGSAGIECRTAMRPAGIKIMPITITRWMSVQLLAVRARHEDRAPCPSNAGRAHTPEQRALHQPMCPLSDDEEIYTESSMRRELVG